MARRTALVDIVVAKPKPKQEAARPAKDSAADLREQAKKFDRKTQVGSEYRQKGRVGKRVLGYWVDESYHNMVHHVAKASSLRTIQSFMEAAVEHYLGSNEDLAAKAKAAKKLLNVHVSHS